MGVESPLVKLIAKLNEYKYDRCKIMVKVKDLEYETRIPHQIMTDYLEELKLAERDGELVFPQPDRTEARYWGWFILDLEKVREKEAESINQIALVVEKEKDKMRSEAQKLLDGVT